MEDNVHMIFHKAAVIAPSICDFYFTPQRAVALGAISVQNQLLKYGIETDFFNFPLYNSRGKTIPLPETHSYLEKYLFKGERGPLSFFTQYKRFGPSPDESAELLLQSKAEIVFISLFAWTYGDDAIQLATSIRKKETGSQKTILCIGGPGVTVLPEYFQNSKLFDFIITGAAEETIAPLISELSRDKSNFSEVPHLFGNGKSSNEISQSSPEPAVSFRKDKKGNQWLSVILSRGCPLRCKFCSNFLTQGRTFRSTPLEELEKVLKDLPVDKTENIHINLEDDNLLVKKSYFTEALQLMKKIFHLSTFSIKNGLDYTNMTNDYIDFLIDSGFSQFTLSLGSSDLNTLKEEKRPANLVKFEKTLEYLKKKMIPVTTFLICGLPEDNTDTILCSLLYLHKLSTDIGISLFYPVPGLPRFEDKNLFLEKSSRLCSGSSAYPWGNSLTTKELVTSFRLARLSNLINKRDKSKEESELIDRIRTTGKLHSFQGKENRVIEILYMNESLVSGFLADEN